MIERGYIVGKTYSWFLVFLLQAIVSICDNFASFMIIGGVI